MIPVGNAVIKAAKSPGNLVASAMKKNATNAAKQDATNRANAPVGAYGGTNKGTYQMEKSDVAGGKEKIYYPPEMKVNTSLKYKGRSTSDGYMPRR
jgi:hypothetical protein